MDGGNGVSGLNIAEDINPDGFFNDTNDTNACSVRVAVRVRPLVGRELLEGGQRTCVDVDPSQNKILIGDKNFVFDKVFAAQERQQEIFDICARNLVLGCFAGFNATILAYGQTGSGKTHTMGTGSTFGINEEQIGIVPRVFSFIFEELNKRKEQSAFSQFTIKVQFLELYNEELHDLLDPASMGLDRITGKPLKELQIREEKNGTISIQGLKEEIVNSKEECLQLLNKGIAHRTTSATLMNEGSSRSHAIFTVAIEQKIVKDLEGVVENNPSGEVPNQSEEHITAKFHFVDLAGSERIKKTGATGQVLKEGISINKGLLALGNVISALTQESQKVHHIPYRDSKLTRILQDSLGGNSRTTMIACVSPAESNYEESINSLKYASRARNIKNKPVINRDPNSMLIDSLRTQISSLQGEITEYQKILKANNIELSEEQKQSISTSAAQPQQQNNKSPTKVSSQMANQQTNQPVQQSGGNFNFQELREVKIKLSKKEKELKDLQEQLVMVSQKVKQKEAEMEEITKERDNLRLKNEILSECIQKNNIQVEGMLPNDNNQTLSLIDEYKSKLAQLEQLLEKKEAENQAQSRKIGQIQVQQQRDEELLRKHLEENQRLKRQIKKFEEGGQSLPSTGPSTRRAAESKPEVKKRADLEQLISKDLFSEKFMNSLSNQLESIFTAADEDESKAAKEGGSAEDTPTETDDLVHLHSIDEKEKILEAVKNSAKQMQGELVELMKSEYDKKITEIEKDMAKVDLERQSSIKNASADSKQVQALELQYKQKMEDLQKQLKEFKDKEKKQEQIVKQINNQETKIKTMETDLSKMKKSKEQMEQQIKQETEKFNKLKKQTAQELNQAKKAVADKDKIVQKLKLDLKKTDQLAQNKLAELRGLQKRSQEERLKREQAKLEENEAKGIDIDRIKAWINENTNKMLESRDLKDQLEKQVDEREQIEEDMLGLGEKLSDLMLQKERKDAEKTEMELETDIDEGKLYELEEELDNIAMEMQQITDNLDSMDETLDFINRKINILSEEIAAIDIDNIQPIQFSGLKSVDAAKVTLQTFFGVLLDLNIYKRDLEAKCIEQDEEILSLNDKIRILQVRIEELINNGSIPMQQIQAPDRIMAAQNTKAINKIVETLDGFVEYSELKNLNLTANEQTSLTKLSLSKIVSNLKTKLKEEETKNQNLSHKLEQAINEKEQVKQKFDNFKKQQKLEAFNNNPLASSRAVQKQESSVPVNPTTKQSTNGVNQPPQKLEFKFKSRMEPLSKKEETSVPAITVTKPTHSRNSTLMGQNSVPVGKPSQNMGQKRMQTENSTSVTRELKKPSLANRNVRTPRRMDGKDDTLNVKEIKMSLGQNRPQSSMGGATKLPSLKDRRNQKKQEAQDSNQSQQEQSLLEIKVTDMQTSTTTKQVATGQSLKDRRMAKKLNDIKDKARPTNSRPSSSMALLNNSLMQQQQPSQPPPTIPSLKDKRNQRKALHKEEEEPAEVKLEELDSIKDQLQSMATKDPSERTRSRARAFSKLGERSLFQHNTSQNSGNGQDESMMSSKGQVQETIVEMPSIMSMSSVEKINKVPVLDMDYLNCNIEDNMYNNDPQPEQDQPQMISPSKDQMDTWTKDELLIVENKGHKLVDFDCVSGKLMMVFGNFNLEEYDIETEEQTKEVNLKEINGQDTDDGEVATSLAIDKELGMIAVGGTQGVYIFDYQDNFTLVTKIEKTNVKCICFCQFNVVVLASDGSASQIALYSLDEDFQEIGSYEIDGVGIGLKTDGQAIYFSLDTQIGKLTVPELQLEYQVESEHSAPIIDFAPSNKVVFTTSKDSSLKGLDKDNGVQVIPTIEELECDTLEAEDNFLLTRCGGGAAFLVWKQSNSLGEDMVLIDEIEQEDFETETLNFRMKGKITAKIQGFEYKLVLMVTTTPEAYIVQALKHKPLYS